MDRRSFCASEPTHNCVVTETEKGQEEKPPNLQELSENDRETKTESEEEEEEVPCSNGGEAMRAELQLNSFQLDGRNRI